MPKTDEQQKKKSFVGDFRLKKKQTISAFVVNPEGIDSTVEELRELLLSSGYEKKNAVRLSFALDTLLLGWYEHGLEDAPAELFVEKIFGQKKLVVEVCGKADSVEQEESSQSYPWMGNLKENGLAWSSTQTNKGMRAELTFSKKGLGSGAKFLIAIAAAVTTVFILSALPGNALAAANETLFDPLFDIGLGLLTALIGPMVFLSIMSGILGAGDIDTLKQLGYFTTTRIMQANTIGLVVATVGTMLILGTNFSFNGGSTNFANELLDPLFGIIPTSFFQPFIDGNILQITVWAIIFGIVALLIKPRIPVVVDAVFELNSLLQRVVISISRIMPVFIYLAFVGLLSNISGEMIATMLRFFIVFVLAGALVIVALMILATRRRAMRFQELAKSMLPVWTTAFLTSSSTVTFPTMCETLEKLSVRESVIGFHTPIAISASHPGSILEYMLLLATATCLGGYTIGVTQLILMMVLCFIMGVATPTVPGGTIAILALLLQSMGFDAAALPLFIAVSPIMGMIDTVPNASSVVLTALQVDSDLLE